MLLATLLIAIVAIISGVYWYGDTVKEFPTCDPKGSAIVITGCSSGIGYHATHFLANKGYVIYAAVRKESDFQKFNNNSNIIPLIMDVTNITALMSGKDFISDHLSANGLNLVGLVNNAGIGYASAVSEADLKIIQNVMAVNVYGVVDAVQNFLPLLRLRKDGNTDCGPGRIINIGSISGLLASPLYGIYSASKYALEAITESLRMETYRYNVSVSIVNPGTILDTSIRQKNLTSILANEKPDVEIKSVANSDYQEWIAFTRKRLKRADAERIGDSPIIVSEAIYHAISHKYPRTRYIVGRVGKFPCWLMNLMKVVLPDRLFDMLLLAAPEAG